MTVCSCPNDDAQPSGSAQHQSGFFELGEHGKQQTFVQHGADLLPPRVGRRGQARTWFSRGSEVGR